ncbi:ABC transporter permease [Neomoorella humiferrea]|uniref:Inner membrane transport permease YbhR n=1 Tax=Neomoorella humiferrea TaxID=676965 RepID=A0A2T0AUS9_9FIRM|nr:ABC transporter permease [Moorella humiferrea]PRR74254.1 Inner membrane transport permease YbhR [Moorella humiferrea]
MLRQCLAIMRREVFYLWRDRGLRYILFCGSILGLLLFYAVYSAQVLKDIPTAVVDLDNSAASRELVDKIGKAEYLKLVASVTSYDDLQELIKQGKAVVGVVIPENYGRNLALGRQARVLAVIDGSNMIYATNASAALLTVTRTLSAQAGVSALVARGVQLQQAKEAYQAIDISEEAWFNPALNYAYFLVLALALNIWQQCCTLAACLNVIGERGMKSWLQIKACGISKFRLFASKSMAQIFIFMAVVLPVYVLAFGVFRLPLNCSLPALLLFTLAFAVAIHSIGTLASSFARNAVDAARFGMIIALPSFVLSGYTWPLEPMPVYLQKVAWILPQTWFFQGINYFAFKNAGWNLMAHYILAMLAVAAVCYGAAAVFIARS